MHLKNPQVFWKEIHRKFVLGILVPKQEIHRSQREFFSGEFFSVDFFQQRTYPKTHSELVEEGDPNASPSNHTIENVVFGPAFETTTQEMSILAQLLNSHQTKY